jgi:uncharacterized membrane protein
MKGISKKILLGLLVALLAVQFIRPGKNKSTKTALQNANYVTAHYPASAQVTNILQKSCNNCHTNNTNYIW